MDEKDTERLIVLLRDFDLAACASIADVDRLFRDAINTAPTGQAEKIAFGRQLWKFAVIAGIKDSDVAEHGPIAALRRLRKRL